jgi:nicotinamidase-related amidase
VKGTWGAAIVDELDPAEGDILIEGKRGLDTFASTNLDFILRNKGIDTVILGGFLTRYLAKPRRMLVGSAVGEAHSDA